MKMCRYIFSIMLILLLNSMPAYADAGLPMIIIVWPVFWFALIPIIFIEWFVLKRILLDFSSKRLLYVAAVSNFLSTLIGIPLAWIGLLGIEFMSPGGGSTYPSLSIFWRFFLGVTLQSPWLIPYESQFYWMVPTAFIVLLIPFFYISYWLEALVTLKLLKKGNAAPTLIKKAVWKANIQSYAFLLLGSVLFLAYNII